jgi:hypothetical protein
VSDPRFGASTGLLQRLRPSRVTAADLREVADELLPELTTPDLRISLVDRPAAGSVVVLEEGERSVRMPLAELADEMTAAGVRNTPEAIGDALTSWVAHRPVPDAVAASTGIAVLGWADMRRRAVGWRVVVLRGDVAVPWTPSPSVESLELARARNAALGRAAALGVDLRVEGPVGLWSHRVPLLATAVLAAPERLRERIEAAGLPADDLRVVVTPGRPVACAGPAAAARLAGETPENCVVLPWAQLLGLPWL